MTTERKLATIRRIAEVKPIQGKDRVVSYRVDGWWVTDAKDKYEVGDLVVYLEPDSWVPTTIAPFLSKGKEPREFEGVKGERLKTIKIGGVLSQGLLLPLSILGEPHEIFTISEWCEGADVTKQLGILKWEKPIPACLRGQVEGNFPAEIPKTEAVRIQNIKDWEVISKTHTFEITEKLHGSSCTFYLDNDNEFHVCSRNFDLKEDENNAYWKVAKKYNIEQKMRDLEFKGVAIQGELIGEGVNGNQYQINGLDFHVFNVFDVNNNGGVYVNAKVRSALCNVLGLEQVPVLAVNVSSDVQEMLKKAEGVSCLNGSEREGFVLKSQEDTSLIIKVISNRWLLGGGEDQ